MAMKKKNEGKKKIDASRVGKLRYTIIILIALTAVAMKAVFVVPIENKRIDGTSCDEYSKHISLVDYLNGNRLTSCQNYEVNFLLYAIENIVVFIVFASAGFGVASIIPKKEKPTKTSAKD